MPLSIPIETSARHVHMCKEDFELLFGKGAEPTFVKELSQPGQYLCRERVSIRGPKGVLENMAILGPFRSNTQVEISVTDCRKIGIPPVIRQSGDIEGSPGCLLFTPDASFALPTGVIVAKRHIHMTPIDAIRFHVHDGDEVFVIVKSYERSLIYADVIVRVSKSFRLAMHVDTDEANAFLGEEQPTGVIAKLFDGRAESLRRWAEEQERNIYRL